MRGEFGSAGRTGFLEGSDFTKESSQFHPNCLDPGANNAAQTWDLLLPLGDQ